jgi:hypothetical protein
MPILYPVQYRGYTIEFDPPPIPIRTCDYHYVHEDYDGAPDAIDNRAGSSGSMTEAMMEIDDLIADEEAV